jgi:hypothetical protein
MPRLAFAIEPYCQTGCPAWASGEQSVAVTSDAASANFFKNGLLSTSPDDPDSRRQYRGIAHVAIEVRGKSRDVPSSARSGKEVRINSVAPYSTGSLKLGTNTRSGPVEIAKRQFAGYKIGVDRGITETMQIDVRDILARNAVFAVLSPARRRALAESGTQVKLEKGQKLFSRGDEPDAAYPIISGEIEVSITGPDGRNVFIARLPGGSSTAWPAPRMRTRPARASCGESNAASYSKRSAWRPALPWRFSQ